MEIVKVTLKVEELLKVTHEFQGVQYLTFELAKMQSTDDYGRTHTAYVSTREDAEAEEAPKDKKAKKDKKKDKKAKTEEPVLEMADQDLPF